MTSGQGIPIGDLRILRSGSSPLRWAGLLTPVFTLLTRDRRQGWSVCVGHPLGTDSSWG